MRKTSIILLLATTLLAPKFLQTEYTLTTEVIEVQQPSEIDPNGYVVCKADNGNCYSFYGSEDWFEGDIAELTINDNGTTYRLDDDKVISATYKGYIY